MYEKFLGVIDEHSEEICGISDAIYDNSELAFKEYFASNLLKDSLRANGFEIYENLGGIPTAFKAVYGKGYPNIGVLAEYDGLSGMSQEGGAAEEKSIPGCDTNHGCGHNLFAGGSFAAALAVKAYIDAKGEGTVTFFGCPAEEGGAGKTFLARDGVFSGVDAVVSHHPERMYMVRTRPSLACVKVEYYFTGIAAHAGGAPHLGRSALDAVELMNVGANFLREHMETTSRIHYAIIDAGGDAPNMVQSHAAVSYMIRAVEAADVAALVKRVDKIAEGAALMTETTVRSKITSAYSNLITIPTLQRVADESMRDTPLPVPTEEEIAYAQALRKTMRLDERRLAEFPFATEVLTPAPPVAHGGSTDTADVSWNTPTVQMHIANWAKDTPGHSWQSSSQSRASYAKRAMLYAGKAVAGTVMRLMDDHTLIEKAKAEHFEKTGGKYETLLPKDVLPPID